MICMVVAGKKKELHNKLHNVQRRKNSANKPAKAWRAAFSSLAGSGIIFLITLPARFQEVRRVKPSVLKNEIWKQRQGSNGEIHGCFFVCHFMKGGRGNVSDAGGKCAG